MEVKIIPTGGLCNRLRAIATGVAVAKSYHCPSVIYWNNSLGLKADYCELFKPIPQEDVKLVENKQWLYNINGNKDYLVRWPLLKTMFEKNRVQLQYLPRWRDIQQIENELFTLAPSHLVLSDVYKIYHPGDVHPTG